MSGATPEPKLIFLDAIEIACPSARAEYVEEACGSDAALRARVEKLLEAHDHGGRFLGGLDAAVATLPPPIAEKPGASIGPYKLLQQIGEGGMGTVYMAEQTHPVRRKVALKVIKPGMDSRQVIARFEAERQALAMMDHANIARVLDAGTIGEVRNAKCEMRNEEESSGSIPHSALRTPHSEGRPYFVMELVHGVPITDYCDDNRLTPRDRLELFVPVCQAIQHAHQKGIIHRDIKPSNVLITLYDGRPVPKVIDFGVAKATEQTLAERTLFTQYGTLVGTLEYMSPEQAEMSALGADTRSDVYSLGVLLYELLTGSTPLSRKRIREAPYADVLRMITEEEPPRPSTRLCDSGETLVSIAARRRIEPAKLTKLIRGELDWIVMKCLEKDRNRRYDTASSLAADVRRYLNNEAVSACPPSAPYRFRKFARRNKAALATASLAGLGLLLLVAMLAASTVLIAREQRVTQSAKIDLEKTLKRERQDSYFHRIALAQRELAANNLRRARELLDECPPDLRRWEWDYLTRLCRVEPLILRDQTEVNSVAFSPDGEYIASAGRDGTVKIWNSRTGKVIQSLSAHAGFASSVAFHPAGKHLVSVGADAQVKVWELETEQVVFSGPCDVIHTMGTAYAVAFSPDGRLLAAGSDGEVRVWEWSSGQPPRILAGHAAKPISVAFSRDGRRLATGSWYGAVQLWDPEIGGEPLCIFPESRESRKVVGSLAFSPDGALLATADFGRRVDVWDTNTGRRLRKLPHYGGIVLAVAFSPDGSRLASSGEDKTVRLWDATTGREVLGLRGHTGMCGCVAFSPDGRRLASASADRTIRIWDAAPLSDHEGRPALDFTQQEDEIWSVAVSPQGEIASGGFDTRALVWDAQTGQNNGEFRGQSNVIFCVAWDPEGRRIASSGGNGDHEMATVKVWNAKDGRTLFTIPGGPQEIFAVAFSPDGRHLVTGGANRTVQVWDAQDGAYVGPLGAHEGMIRGVVFSRDGRRLASASADGVVKLWDATRLDEEQEDPGIPVRVPAQCLNIALSPDGLRLASGGEDNTVKIWDMETREVLHTLRGHSGEIYTIAFSPDDEGRWLASAGEDSTVKIWDSFTGEPVKSLRGHLGLVSSVTFTPDGRLVSGSRDHTVKVWDVTQWNGTMDRWPVQER